MFIVNSQNSLFNLGMFTYSYQSPNIIQIALNKLPGGGKHRNKKDRHI
jgi:hypothetical protein